jgi:hypothetical protein
VEFLSVAEHTNNSWRDMVRHKTRWLLVKLDFREDIKNKNKTIETEFPSKKEISFYIRQNVSSCFGIAADGAALDTQGGSGGL